MTCPGERFAYLVREDPHLMQEQSASWDPCVALEHPYGSASISPSMPMTSARSRAAVVSADYELFLRLEERWFERGADAVRQFAVPDRDRYLLMISQHPHLSWAIAEMMASTNRDARLLAAPLTVGHRPSDEVRNWAAQGLNDGAT
jgi:hypothetical protein